LVTADLDLNQAYKIPIAHGEGRFYASEEVMNQLRANDQVLFRYCTADGEVTAEANPNGATDNIAGICNAGRNVFGMMPHPERAADGNLWNQDGLAIFKSILERVPA
jgi:phosphoribosylformylglycinamidine synthase